MKCKLNDSVCWIVVILQNFSALQSYETMKVSYGMKSCFLLRLNSVPVGYTGDKLPDPWCRFLASRIESGTDMWITPESPPESPRENTPLEVGQEASESGTTLDYHPLSPNVDDVSLVLIVLFIQLCNWFSFSQSLPHQVLNFLFYSSLFLNNICHFLCLVLVYLFYFVYCLGLCTSPCWSLFFRSGVPYFLCCLYHF